VFRYSLFDSVICSDSELPELALLSPAVPIGVLLKVGFSAAVASPIPLQDTELQPWRDDSDRVLQGRFGESILIRVRALADFVVQPAAASVQCRPGPGAHPFHVRHFLLNQALPRLVSFRDHLVIHASAVNTDCGGIGLIGASGSGKSTLAAHYVQSGAAELISDDGILVRQAGQSFRLVGAYACSRLRSDSVNAIGASEQAMPGGPYGAKHALRVTSVQRSAPTRPVARAFFVLTQTQSDPRDIVVTPLTGFAAVMALIANSFLLDPGDRRLVRGQFEAAARLVQSGCPFYSLTYPRRFADLPHVWARIRSALGG